MKEPPRATANTPPDEIADAVRLIQDVLRRLEAAPGALAPAERLALAQSVEPFADFVLAAAVALFQRVRQAVWERPAGGVGTIAEAIESGGSFQDLEDRINDCKNELLDLLHARRAQARAKADDVDLVFETERLSELVALTGIAFALWKRLPGPLANFGSAYGYDLGELLDDAGVEPPFSFALREDSDGGSEQRNK